MKNVTLKIINETNFIDCFNLKLAIGQDKYVSHPIRSLAQAYVYRSQCVPFGIYAEGGMIGYVLVIYDYDEEAYNVWHMMIDEKFQKHGYGTGAIKEVLYYISTKPFGKSNKILLTCNPKNKIAYKLYTKIGFVDTGRSDDDEIELGIELQP